MQYRRLGNSGLHVSVLGLGGWLTYVQTGLMQAAISKFPCADEIFVDLEDTLKMVRLSLISYNAPNLTKKEKTIACMKQAYDCGINFFDTAER